MTQLSIFETNTIESKVWDLYVDGASRNNPGESGAGVYILCEKKIFREISVYLGKKTNNQAEYLALLIGLFSIKLHSSPTDVIYIKSDSELLVKQIKGIYSVKDPHLKKYFKYAHEILTHMNYNISHVYRDQNKDADRLANKAVDKKVELPSELSSLWHSYDL